MDPNFLMYTTTPIEISVVVRRNTRNDPVKLTLTYESTTGYKKAQPYEVPDNEKWHTATWKIDDAQFRQPVGLQLHLELGELCDSECDRDEGG